MNYDKIFVGDNWQVSPKYYPLVFLLTLGIVITYPFQILRQKKLNKLYKINGQVKAKK